MKSGGHEGEEGEGRRKVKGPLLLQWPASGVSLRLSVTPETMLARWRLRREGQGRGLDGSRVSEGDGDEERVQIRNKTKK